MASPVLLCTDLIWAGHADRLRAVAADLRAVTLVGDDPVPADDLAQVEIAFFSADSWPDRAAHLMKACILSPDLRWLHTFSAGVDNPVFARFLARGVRLTTSSGATAPAIAETVMMYLLALSRDLPAWSRAQAEHRWIPHEITELDGMTVGVVGFGPIGVEVARLATAFGMRPIAVRRSVCGDEPCETWTLDRLPELAAVVDALVVALPLNADTAGLIDAAVIDAMRPGALFVNVGRGELVDEAALTDALATERLGGAGLDVFAAEPLPPDSALWDLPNVVITPHSSGTSARSHARAVDLFIDNLAAYVAGTPMQNEVQPLELS